MDFSHQTVPSGWPASSRWPMQPLRASFLVHGVRVDGGVHHLNRLTTWVWYDGKLIKRHDQKHGVEFIP